MSDTADNVIVLPPVEYDARGERVRLTPAERQRLREQAGRTGQEADTRPKPPGADNAA